MELGHALLGLAALIGASWGAFMWWRFRRAIRYESAEANRQGEQIIRLLEAILRELKRR